MKSFYFGTTKTPLFGSYYPARGVSSRAVLLCPPIGHEYTRSHRALRNLANGLADRGYHALLFDYRGIGDSQGAMEQVGNIALWLDDIQTATRELLDETMATQIHAIGLRFGANLLSEATARLPDLRSLTLWEPYSSGQDFLNNHRKTQALMLSVWMQERMAINTNDIEEILGYAYPKTLIRDIEKLTLDQKNDTPEQHIVSCCAEILSTLSSTYQNIWKTQDVCDWNDQTAMELAWLGASGVGQILALFEQRIGMARKDREQ